MPTKSRTTGARQFFSRHGTLSKWHPKYEFRAGQVQMAEAVEAAPPAPSVGTREGKPRLCLVSTFYRFVGHVERVDAVHFVRPASADCSSRQVTSADPMR